MKLIGLLGIVAGLFCISACVNLEPTQDNSKIFHIGTPAPVMVKKIEGLTYPVEIKVSGTYGNRVMVQESDFMISPDSEYRWYQSPQILLQDYLNRYYNFALTRAYSDENGRSVMKGEVPKGLPTLLVSVHLTRFVYDKTSRSGLIEAQYTVRTSARMENGEFEVISHGPLTAWGSRLGPEETFNPGKALSSAARALAQSLTENIAAIK